MKKPEVKKNYSYSLTLIITENISKTKTEVSQT